MHALHMSVASALHQVHEILIAEDISKPCATSKVVCFCLLTRAEWRGTACADNHETYD